MLQRATFSDQIRQVIKESGISRYALSKRTGIDQANLCRFVHGQSAVTTDTLDRLAEELDLRIEKKTENKTPRADPKTRGFFVSVEKGMLANVRKRMPKKQR